MALYQPVQKLVKFNGILISNLEVEVGKGEYLFEMWNFSNSKPNVTNIAYKVIKDPNQMNAKVYVTNKIPWNGESLTVIVTIYTPDSEYPVRATSNNSDDAEIDKGPQG